MKAVILVGTLKREEDADKNSRTLALSRQLAEALQERDAEVRIVRLADLDPPNEKGPPPWVGVKKQIIDEVLEADIVVLATPIWWNNHSSLIQRVVEYLDDRNDLDIEEAGEEMNGTIQPLHQTSFDGKVFGCIVVGSEDGTQHVAGNLLNFAHWLGFHIPPMASVTQTKTSEEEVEAMIERASESLVRTAHILKETTSV